MKESRDIVDRQLVRITSMVRGLQACGLLWTFLVVTSNSDVRASDLQESGTRLQLASEIEKKYVRPFGLKGMPGSQAIETLLAEGFRCNLLAVSPFGLIDNPLSDCIKQPSGFGSQCEKLVVTLRLQHRPGIATREDLLRHLGTIKVDSALAFCPYVPNVSAQFLAARSAAEQELARQVAPFELQGNARAAYDKLLLEGFYCGFIAAQAAEADHGYAPKLACTRQPTGIEFCFEAMLVLTVEWPTTTLLSKELFSELPNARVSAVQSSCVVPELRSLGPRL